MADKPQLIEVTDCKELRELHAGSAADLDRPYVFSQRIGSRIHFYVDANDMRAWRESQHTSGVPRAEHD